MSTAHSPSRRHWSRATADERSCYARPMQPDWVRDLRDQCDTGQVAFFFKQWGGRTPKAGGRLLDGRTHDDMPPLASPGNVSRTIETVAARSR